MAVGKYRPGIKQRLLEIDLTPREQFFTDRHKLTLMQGRIMALLVRGMTMKEVAARIGYTTTYGEQTVKNAMKVIYDKLGIRGDIRNKAVNMVIKVLEYPMEPQDRFLNRAVSKGNRGQLPS